MNATADCDVLVVGAGHNGLEATASWQVVACASFA